MEFNSKAQMSNINLVAKLTEELKRLGYEKIVTDTQKRLIIYIPDTERRDALKSIAKTLNGKYVTSGPGWKSSVGGVTINNLTVLAKPEADSKTVGSLTQLDSRVFTTLGKSAKFNSMGESISCVAFTSAQEIEKSIINGSRNNNLLGESVADTFEGFFRTGKFIWDPEISIRKKNIIGVYAGEVLPGWVLFSRNTNKFFATNPFRGTPEKFYLPTNPQFYGVDSFIKMQDGTYYSISSKFGRGAQASFFSNIFETGIKNKNKLQKSVFKDILETASSNGLAFNKSRPIVYTYGIRNILKLSSKEVPDPSKVYDLALQKQLNNETLNLVLTAIKQKDPSIKDLPLTMSNFFNKAIATALNNDPKSVEQIKEILRGKDYWQGNLNITDWLNGELKFNWLSTASTQLKFIGYKSVATDLSCKQGWINYELKYTR